MDNITHSLIGAVLGQAGLKRRTGLAMQALIIGANLPDVDAPCSLYGVESLAMRRGISHGPLAVVLLPLVLAALLIAYDRWQAKRGTRPEGRLAVHPGWLLALCYIGTFTHLLFDWFNNYGIRLLEPFSSQWFYGDTLFIIDIWVLAALIGGVWLSRRRERAGLGQWQRPARIVVAGVLAYAAFNLGLSRALVNIAKADAPYPVVAVANALPVTFWQREMLLRTADGEYASMHCTWLNCERGSFDLKLANMADSRVARWASGDPAAEAFLFWSRMPIAEIDGDRVVLKDQRFLGAISRGPFAVELKPRP